MKNTGMTRTVDELGRIVIPKSMRQNLNIADRDEVEIFVEGDRIILRKHTGVCLFCGNSEELTEHMGKKVCAACVRALGNNP